MTIHLFVGIISSVLLLTSFAITKRNRAEAHALRSLRKKEAEIEEELIIHTGLEKAGLLPKHHTHHHKGLHQKSKKLKLYMKPLFYSIGYTVIVIELYYLYQMIRDIILL